MTDTTNPAPETTADRLKAAREAQDARRLAEVMYERGFDNEDDYALWSQLEELRHITLDERRAERKSNSDRNITTVNLANGVKVEPKSLGPILAA